MARPVVCLSSGKGGGFGFMVFKRFLVGRFRVQVFRMWGGGVQVRVQRPWVGGYEIALLATQDSGSLLGVR